MTRRPATEARLRANRAARAVTLVELLVAMSVLLAVMAATLTVFLPSLGRFAQADTEYDAQRHAMTAITAMAADLRESRVSNLVAENAASEASAFFIPTPRNVSGTFVLNPDADPLEGDMPQRQGWIAYYTSEDPLEGTKGLFRLHRAFVNDRDGALGGGRVVASGLRKVSVQIGDNDSLDPSPVANGHIWLKIERSGPLSWTAGGRGVVRLEVVTERVLHDHITSARGEKTIHVPY